MTDAPVFSKGRDLDALVSRLQPWLAERLGTSDVEVGNLSYPRGAGTSNETILLDIRRPGGTDELVFRAEPRPEYQMFLETEFRMQYDLLRTLRQSGLVRVPDALWFEDDPAVTGQTFFVMRRMQGRVPVSMPVYNTTGWLYEASPAQRRTLWEAAMEQLTAIHCVPVDDVRFVDRPALGSTGLVQQLTYWTRFVSWAGDDQVPDTVRSILQWLTENVPDEPAGLSWGDARIGNIMFGDDFDVVGVMDWEQASLAGGAADLGWWLFFDDIHSVDQGVPRLDGLGGRQETIDLWQERTGLRADHLRWHEVFAGIKTTLLGLRSRRLMNVAHLDTSQASPFLAHACRLLDLPVPEGS